MVLFIHHLPIYILWVEDCSDNEESDIDSVEKEKSSTETTDRRWIIPCLVEEDYTGVWKGLKAQASNL